MTKLRDRLPSVALAITMVLSVGAGFADPPAPVPEISPGVVQGYLAKEGLPDSAELLPPPPALGSAGLALDQEVGRAALAMRDSPRWKLAAMDADLTFPNAAGTFSCALGAPVTEQDTPHLYQMLRRVLTDAGLATYAAKDKYQHARPFMLDDQPICTPDKDKSLRMQGSYPSGHTSAGWAWALVLAEASPGQSDAIFARRPRLRPEPPCLQRAWESDVIEGQPLARLRSPASMPTRPFSRIWRRPRTNYGGSRQAASSAARLCVRGRGSRTDAAAGALSAVRAHLYILFRLLWARKSTPFMSLSIPNLNHFIRVGDRPRRGEFGRSKTLQWTAGLRKQRTFAERRGEGVKSTLC